MKTGNRVLIIVSSHYHYYIIFLSGPYNHINLSCDYSLHVVTSLCFFFVPRHMSASSECLSRKREACCNYSKITPRPNTSFAALSFLRTRSHTHSTTSHNNSNTLMHTSTKSIQTGSHQHHLLWPVLQVPSQPENWLQSVEALCSIQPKLFHEQ